MSSLFLQDQPRVVVRHSLQSFTDPIQEEILNGPEQKVWTVQYSGTLPLENQRINQTQMFYNKQTSSDDIKDSVKDMR